MVDFQSFLKDIFLPVLLVNMPSETNGESTRHVPS